MTEETESIADALLASMNEVEPDTESEETTDSISQEAITEDVETEVVEASEEDNDESEEQETVFQAPDHWSSDERSQFDSLPPEARELLIEKEKQFQTGYQEKAQTISAITEAIKPWEQSLAQRGVTAEQAIRTLFAAQHSLDTDAIQGILQIAQSYGVTDQLREQFAPQTDDDDFTDPGIKALQQEIKGLKSQMDQTNQGIQQQGASVVQQQIDTFQSATNTDGTPKHPHFEQVKTLMGAYVQGGDTLDSAYDKAVWTIPEFRASQDQKVVEKTETEKAQQVKKAKRAARGVKTNGKASPNEGAEAVSLHDDLAEAFRQHS